MIGRLKSYAALAFDWLLSRFDDAGNLQRILKAFADEIQELEDAIHEQLSERLLENATGDQLDQYGELVDQPRDGRSDDTYRVLIRVKILRNTSEGTPERLIKILNKLTRPQLIDYTDGGGVAELVAYDTNAISGVLSETHRILQDAAPSGVRVSIIQANETDSFRYDTGPGYDEGEYAKRI